MSFLSKLVGIGLVAGAAVAAVKLIEKVWPQDNALDDVVNTVETGEFPQEDGTDAEDAPEAPYRPFDPDAALAPVASAGITARAVPLWLSDDATRAQVARDAVELALPL